MNKYLPHTDVSLDAECLSKRFLYTHSNIFGMRLQTGSLLPVHKIDFEYIQLTQRHEKPNDDFRSISLIALKTQISNSDRDSLNESDFGCMCLYSSSVK